jgi:hypothetical protein
MNKIENNFNKNFSEKKSLSDIIYERRWQLVSLFLMLSLLLLSLGYRDNMNKYAEVYAKWYCYNNAYGIRINTSLPNVSK